MTADYVGGLEPFQPFALRVPVQTADPFSDELVSITVGKSWVAYIIGCVQALNAASSWATQDAATIQQMRTWVANLTAQLMTWSVPMDLVFRRNPTNPVAADYSVDGGATWVAMPDTWAYFYPEFTSDLATPSGYQLSVNYGNTVEVVPQMNNVVNDAVRTDPSGSIVNTVSTATGITPLELISGGTVSLLIQSQEKAIAMARKAGFDTSSAAAFLEITKTVADVGDVLVTVISP